MKKFNLLCNASPLGIWAYYTLDYGSKSIVNRARWEMGQILKGYEKQQEGKK